MATPLLMAPQPFDWKHSLQQQVAASAHPYYVYPPPTPAPSTPAYYRHDSFTSDGSGFLLFLGQDSLIQHVMLVDAAQIYRNIRHGQLHPIIQRMQQIHQNAKPSWFDYDVNVDRLREFPADHDWSHTGHTLQTIQCLTGEAWLALKQREELRLMAIDMTPTWDKTDLVGSLRAYGYEMNLQDVRVLVEIMRWSGLLIESPPAPITEKMYDVIEKVGCAPSFHEKPSMSLLTSGMIEAPQMRAKVLERECYSTK